MEAIKAKADEIKRIEVEIGDANTEMHTEAFSGRWLVEDYWPTEADMEEGDFSGGSVRWAVALTRHGRLATYCDTPQGSFGSLSVTSDIEDMAADENYPVGLVAAVRAELTGEDVVIERDI